MTSHFEQKGLYKELAQLHGLPLFVYDTSRMEHRLQCLSTAFSGFPHRIHFAAKALSNQAVLSFFASKGCGLDAVSIQEVQLGLLAGFSPGDILFTSNNVAFEELEEAVAFGVHLNMDSLSALEKFGQRFGSSWPVFIRLNPHILAGGNPKIQTGHIDSKFGISIFQLPEIERICKKFKIVVEGLHIHTGSEFLEPEVFLQGAEIVFNAASSFPDLKFLDFGSGFKVAYKKGDLETPVDALGKKMELALAQFYSRIGKELTVIFEPGKFLVSDSGVLLCEVNTIKKTPVSVFLGVNTGLNHLIRPMMYDAYHSIENISSDSESQHIYTIAGNICETDTLGYSRSLPETREGDILAIHNAGAYGFSMASQYNSRFRPAEVLLHKGQAHLIRRRETIDDLLRNQIAWNPGK
jgi:diaminopimelate decarboxylase